jgi:hypothetical protein
VGGEGSSGPDAEAGSRLGSAQTNNAPTMKPNITHEGTIEGLGFGSGGGVSSASNSLGSCWYIVKSF